MTDDATIRDEAVAALKLTTVGYRNKSWVVPPPGSQWAKGLALLAEIAAPPPSGVAPPLPPAAYQIPTGGLVLPPVTNGPVTITGPTFAPTLGGAVINGPVTFVRGSLQGVIVNGTIDAGACLAPPDLQDLWVHGGGAETAIYCYRPDGLVAQRIVADGFTNYGIRASDNSLTSTSIIKAISDLDFNGGNQNGATGGTGESPIWIGNPVAGGVQRIRARGGYSCAIWRGGSHANTAWTDIEAINDVGPGTAWYDEHQTTNCSVDRFSMTSQADAGRVYQGEYKASFDVGAVKDCTFSNGTMTGGQLGFAFTQSDTVDVSTTKFVGQTQGGIRFWLCVGACTSGANGANDFSQLAAGAVPVFIQ